MGARGRDYVPRVPESPRDARRCSRPRRLRRIVDRPRRAPAGDTSREATVTRRSVAAIHTTAPRRVLRLEKPALSALFPSLGLPREIGLASPSPFHGLRGGVPVFPGVRLRVRSGRSPAPDTSASVVGDKQVFCDRFGSVQGRLPPPGCTGEPSAADEEEGGDVPTLRNPAYRVGAAWREMVHAYRTQRLSYECDRLLAIGAVAEHIQASRADEVYLAGLWSGSLHADLL